MSAINSLKLTAWSARCKSDAQGLPVPPGLSRPRTELGPQVVDLAAIHVQSVGYLP